jgi:hypothetical protein
MRSGVRTPLPPPRKRQRSGAQSFWPFSFPKPSYIPWTSALPRRVFPRSSSLAPFLRVAAKTPMSRFGCCPDRGSSQAINLCCNQNARVTFWRKRRERRVVTAPVVEPPERNLGVWEKEGAELGGLAITCYFAKASHWRFGGIGQKGKQEAGTGLARWGVTWEIWPWLVEEGRFGKRRTPLEAAHEGFSASKKTGTSARKGAYLRKSRCHVWEPHPS